jgi:NADPH:quinone reductase-like Zn-dependent oxidoreductase
LRAAEYDRYGDSSVLVVRETSAAVPRGEQILVRVRAAALNPKDILVRKGKYRFFSGRKFPQRVGYDWAGEAIKIGTKTKFESGQKLFGMINAWTAGACAELVAVQPDECAPMPPGLTFEQAAALPLAGLTGLQSLRDLGHVQAGARVCINGASGGVGSLAIQIARCLGARVTTLSSEANVELCRSLGSDEALDYRKDRPFDRRGEFGCIFDVFGNQSFRRVRDSLAPGGIYVSTVPSARLGLDIARSFLSSRKARVILVRSRRKDLEQISQWVEQGSIKPVIDRVMPLDQLREAQEFIATKRARGKVVLAIA